MSHSDDDLTIFCQSQYGPLVGLLSLYTADRHVSEDLAQEALARVCRNWRRVRVMARPDAWLRKVAINLAHSRSRRAMAERRANHRSQLLTSSGVHHDADGAEAIAVRAFVAALPHRQKAVLILHYYADYTYLQIAEILECPEGTVKSLAHRAIRRLRGDINPAEAKEAV